MVAVLALGTFQASAQVQSPAPVPTPAPAPTAAPCVEIKLFNLVEGKGTVKLAVWGSSDTYFKKPVWAQKVKAEGAVMRVPVCGLDVQEIAVTVYQDVNDNGKMDKNPLGIPTEPYGASGTPPMFSAPTWDTTKVAWVADQTLEIRL